MSFIQIMEYETDRPDEIRRLGEAQRDRMPKADGVRVATLTIAGQIVAGTAFDPERIAERYWEVVQSDGPWQAEFRYTGE